MDNLFSSPSMERLHPASTQSLPARSPCKNAAARSPGKNAAEAGAAVHWLLHSKKEIEDSGGRFVDVEEVKAEREYWHNLCVRQAEDLRTNMLVQVDRMQNFANQRLDDYVRRLSDMEMQLSDRLASTMGVNHMLEQHRAEIDERLAPLASVKASLETQSDLQAQVGALQRDLGNMETMLSQVIRNVGRVEKQESTAQESMERASLQVTAVEVALADVRRELATERERSEAEVQSTRAALSHVRSECMQVLQSQIAQDSADLRASMECKLTNLQREFAAEKECSEAKAESSKMVLSEMRSEILKLVQQTAQDTAGRTAAMEARLADLQLESRAKTESGDTEVSDMRSQLLSVAQTQENNRARTESMVSEFEAFRSRFDAVLRERDENISNVNSLNNVLEKERASRDAEAAGVHSRIEALQTHVSQLDESCRGLSSSQLEAAKSKTQDTADRMAAMEARLADMQRETMAKRESSATDVKDMRSQLLKVTQSQEKNKARTESMVSEFEAFRSRFDAVLRERDENMSNVNSLNNVLEKERACRDDEAAGVRSRIEALQTHLSQLDESCRGFSMSQLEAAKSKIQDMDCSATSQTQRDLEKLHKDVQSVASNLAKEHTERCAAVADLRLCADEAKASLAGVGQLQQRFEEHRVRVEASTSESIAELRAEILNEVAVYVAGVEVRVDRLSGQFDNLDAEVHRNAPISGADGSAPKALPPPAPQSQVQAQAQISLPAKAAIPEMPSVENKPFPLKSVLEDLVNSSSCLEQKVGATSDEGTDPAKAANTGQALRDELSTSTCSGVLTSSSEASTRAGSKVGPNVSLRENLQNLVTSVQRTLHGPADRERLLALSQTAQLQMAQTPQEVQAQVPSGVQLPQTSADANAMQATNLSSRDQLKQEMENMLSESWPMTRPDNRLDNPVVVANTPIVSRARSVSIKMTTGPGSPTVMQEPIVLASDSAAVSASGKPKNMRVQSQVMQAVPQGSPMMMTRVPSPTPVRVALSQANRLHRSP